MTSESLEHSTGSDNTFVKIPRPSLDTSSANIDSSTYSLKSSSSSSEEGVTLIARCKDLVQNEDWQALKEIAYEADGFQEDSVRKVVWPYLLGVRGDVKGKGKAKEVEHRDEHQVSLDVNRSFIHLLNGATKLEKQRRKEELSELIVHVLRSWPGLHYFQGYHDIMSILLLVLGDLELAKTCAVKMSLHRLRDSMGPGLDPVLGYLRIMKNLLAQVDPALSSLVDQISALPYFSLSWVLTLLSHDLDSLPAISRLFDVLLTENPAFVVYLGVAMIEAKKEELAALDPDMADDPAILHHTLSKLPAMHRQTSPASSRRAKSSSNTNQSDSDLDTIPSSLSASFISDPSSNDRRSPRSLNSDLGVEVYSDPDISTPAFRPDPASPHSLNYSEPNSPTSPSTSVEHILSHARRLYHQYPLDHPKLRVNTIMGPKSCIRTWSATPRLTDEEAEKIVIKGKDIVIPEVEVKPKPVATRQIGRTLAIVGAVSVLLAAYYGRPYFAGEKQMPSWLLGWGKRVMWVFGR